MVMYPTYARPVELEVILSARNFNDMHPAMKERVQALMEDSGGKVGWGQGVRTPQQQLQLFLERHILDPNGPIVWNGERYSRHKGASAAAPPGRSMHEVGLAADLTGDFGWLAKNVGRFGLVTFTEVNNEPWHVQPVELPKGRQQYEQQGSKWGAYPSYDAPSSTAPDGAASAKLGDPAPGPDTAGDTDSPALTPALVARPGDTGPAARVLMEALVARGLCPDAPASRDSDYGPDDKELVLQFQRENELVVDGEVGPQTWSKLLATVNPGETGPMVKVLQTVLIVRSLIRETAGNLDGAYGPATQQRVQDFQQVSGVDPTAVVGPDTWTALLGVKSRVNVGTRAASAESDVDLDDLDFLAALDGLPAE